MSAGSTADITLEFGPDAFQVWDTATNGWIVEPGEYDLVIGASATDDRGRVRITIA